LSKNKAARFVRRVDISAAHAWEDPMEYVRLGRTGLEVSRICLGMMTYGTSKWRSWVLDAI